MDSVGSLRILVELKLMRRTVGGLGRIERSKIPGLRSLASARTAHGVADQPHWRDEVKALLSHAINVTFDDQTERDAMTALLAIGEMTRQPVEARRATAAAKLNYEKKYFGRWKEPQMLEELASRITSLSDDSPDRTSDLRATIQHLVDLATTAGDPRIANLAVSCGLVPILQLASNVEDIRREFSYRLHLTADDLGDDRVYVASAEYGSRRKLAKEVGLVAICRTVDAMNDWFDTPNVIAVEFAPLGPTAWSAAISERLFTTRVTINGHPLDVQDRSLSDDVVVFTFDLSHERDGEVRLDVRTVFAHRWNYKETTIRLRNHFCLGAFEAEVTVEGDDPIAPIEIYEYISGVDEHDVKVYGNRRTRSLGTPLVAERESGYARVAVNAASVIWPGSGVHFSWYTAG